LRISGGMYSGVAMENCFKFVKRKLLPKSINLTPRMKCPPRVDYYLLNLSRMFYVLRSEWTMLWELIRKSALQTSAIKNFS
jgi:hypothetical protein